MRLAAGGTPYCGKPNIHVRARCYSRAAGVWLFREDDSSLARSQTPLECDYDDHFQLIRVNSHVSLIEQSVQVTSQK